MYFNFVFFFGFLSLSLPFFIYVLSVLRIIELIFFVFVAHDFKTIDKRTFDPLERHLVDSPTMAEVSSDVLFSLLRRRAMATGALSRTEFAYAVDVYLRSRTTKENGSTITHYSSLIWPWQVPFAFVNNKTNGLDVLKIAPVHTTMSLFSHEIYSRNYRRARISLARLK